MIRLTVAYFPLIAVAFSTFACLFPGWLTPLGFLIVPILSLIMLGMGTTLSIRDFARAVKQPKAVLLGFVLQFTVMPLAAFASAHLFNLPEELLIGVVMLGTVGGGTASNVIAYIAGGDVALSITMTACSTIGGVFLTPLLSGLLLGQTVDVPMLAMLKSILMIVIVPVGLGVFINHLMRNKRELLNKICPVFSVAGIVFVIGIIFALNQKQVCTSGIRIFGCIIVHNAIGMLAGYWLAKLFKCDIRTCITIAIEVGMQNSGLAAALSQKFFGIASALPGALFSVWHNLSGALFAGYARNCLLKEPENAEKIRKQNP